jgi:Ca-activated chloride channel family protein
MLSDFHFLRPLWLLALIPLALMLWRLLRAEGDGDAWRGLVDSHLLPRLLSGDTEMTSRLPLALLGLGWLLIVLALAGPVWERLPEPLYQARQFRVLAIDISPTMNATDLAPSRLVRARFELLDLLRQSAEGQTALLAYGAEPYVVAPLTRDVETIAAQVPILDTSLLPLPGARREGLVLEKAGELLSQAGAPDGQVILLTDGLDHPVAAGEAAARLRAQGYRVSVLGFGTDKGGPVTGPDGGFLRDARGAIRLPRLDVTVLRRLADAGGGRYVSASPGDGDIRTLAPDRPGGALGHSGEAEAQAEQWREEGPWLLLVLLPLAALAFRRGWLAPPLLLVFLMPPSDAYALTWDQLWLRPDQQASRLLEHGEPDRAAELFQRPDWRAAAQYRASDYEQALKSLEAIDGPDADYNRGNALARLGRLDEAVAAYTQALTLRPGDTDARHNRDLVQGLLDQRRPERQPKDRPEDQPTDAGEQGDAQQGEQAQAADAAGQQGGSQGESGEQSDQRQDRQQEQAAPDAEQQDRLAGRDADPQRAGQSSDTEQVQSQPAQDRGPSEQQSAGTDTRQPQMTGPADAGEQQQAQAQASPEQRPEGQHTQQQADEAGAEQREETAGTANDPGDSGEPSRPTEGPDGEPKDEGQAGTSGEQPPEHEGPGVDGERPEQAGQDQELTARSDAATGQKPAPRGDQAGAPVDRRDAAGDGSQGAPGGGLSEPRTARADAPGRSDLLSAQPPASGGGMRGEQTPGIDPEDRQAIEQMLRRVDDDPGGLLRQRFLLQHLRRSGQLP